MDEAWDHMGVLEMVVVVWAVDVGGNHAGELASVLLVVRPTWVLDMHIRALVSLWLRCC